MWSKAGSGRREKGTNHQWSQTTGLCIIWTSLHLALPTLCVRRYHLVWSDHLFTSQVQSQSIVARESGNKVTKATDMVKQVSEEIKRLFFKTKCDKYLQKELKGGHLKVIMLHCLHCLRDWRKCVYIQLHVVLSLEVVVDSRSSNCRSLLTVHHTGAIVFQLHQQLQVLILYMVSASAPPPSNPCIYRTYCKLKVFQPRFLPTVSFEIHHHLFIKHLWSLGYN